MKSDITPKKIYSTLEKLPESSLKEVWRFIEFIQFKHTKKHPGKIVKLGGLLANFKLDITEEDISKARHEMWHNLGEVSE